MIERGQGNLLAARVEALVNTVNTEGVMGKGIALQFKKAFPANYEGYRRACKAGEVEVGKVFVTELGTDLPRFLVNFPTKARWRDPSKLAYIDAGLVDLIAQVKARGIRSIAVPPLGCGLGGLAWADVKPRIEAAFASVPDVSVLLFEPTGAPDPAVMPNRTQRPNMTPGRAAILALMNRYLVPGYDYRLSLLEIQKLAYFLQEAGEALRLRFVPHIYGPYADNLRQVLNHIEGHFIEGYGDGRSAPDTPIRLLPGAADEAEAFLGTRPDAQARLDRVAALIEGFETPFGMELLATVHWVVKDDEAAQRDVDAAIEAVHHWSSRKAAKMKPPQIRAAWERMREQGWGSTVGAPGDATMQNAPDQ